MPCRHCVWEHEVIVTNTLPAMYVYGFKVCTPSVQSDSQDVEHCLDMHYHGNRYTYVSPALHRMMKQG